MALTEERKAELDQMAFEMFADAYPHEAAEADWPRFVAYVQKVNPAIPESEVRRLLEVTCEAST
jgi:hypothetical protein